MSKTVFLMSSYVSGEKYELDQQQKINLLCECIP